jgi:hypothetical protein
MRQVLLRLEQADILIADITDNNPNVPYELGGYHAFGNRVTDFYDSPIAEIPTGSALTSA